MDRPILFSAPMVRALLAGTKTQTRRFVTPQPTINDAGLLVYKAPKISAQGRPETIAMCMRIGVGDRLWVRESWRPVGDAALSECTGPDWLTFMATDDEALAAQVKYRPSIHMPRWASRLTLHVIDVRVERLQDISEEDAIAEGWPHQATGGKGAPLRDAYPYGWYTNLWNDINGPGSWEANPWVAAYTFTVERANIDQARAVA